MCFRLALKTGSQQHPQYNNSTAVGYLVHILELENNVHY